QPGYLALKRKLAEIRGTGARPPSVKVPGGKILRLGMRDQRVPLLRARLGLEAGDDQTFDQRVVAAVSEFQKENGLPVSGDLNPRTVMALAPSGAENEGDIVANMERWRW